MEKIVVEQIQFDTKAHILINYSCGSREKLDAEYSQQTILSRLMGVRDGLQAINAELADENPKSSAWVRNPNTGTCSQADAECAEVDLFAFLLTTLA